MSSRNALWRRRMLTPSTIAARVLALAVLGLGIIPAGSQAQAHETKEIGGGRFKIIVGLVREPAYTDMVNGLDLIVRTADNQPVSNLERSISAEIISPDGRARRPLPLRAQFARPGSYTSDFILTQPGVYRIRIWGTVADVSFDETYGTHEIAAQNTLRFP